MVGRLISACGVKPIGQLQWQFKAFWLYGAVERATGEHFFWQFSHVDTNCYQRFLDEFSAASAHSLNILQVDNGLFHTKEANKNTASRFKRSLVTGAVAKILSQSSSSVSSVHSDKSLKQD